MTTLAPAVAHKGWGPAGWRELWFKERLKIVNTGQIIQIKWEVGTLRSDDRKILLLQLGVLAIYLRFSVAFPKYVCKIRIFPQVEFIH